MNSKVAAPTRARSILERVGNTPLIELQGPLTEGIRTPIYMKAEFFNPGGSVKDRIGPAIITAAEREGRLEPGGTIVEGTSGNTGVGLALAAAARGYRCIFTIPDKMSEEKIELLRAFGAEVIITPSDVGPDDPENYLVRARSIAERTPGAILADQFHNQANPLAHYESTGPEIWAQTSGRVTHLIASAGTGGTISGTGRYLKEQNASVRVVSGDPVGSVYTEYARTGEMTEGGPYLVEGVGNDIIPSTLWFDTIDEFRQIDDGAAFMTARRLARETGLLAGGSAGLNLYLALEVAREIDDPEALVVVILPDTGERYLSKFYDDSWLEGQGLLGVDG